MPLDLAAQQEAAALKEDLDLLEVVQTPDHFGPLGGEAFFLHSDFQFPFQAQGQERTEHVPADRLIAFVVNRARLQDALGRAECVLHHPERLVDMSDGFRIVAGVGAQHEEPVIALVCGDQFFIDGKAASPLGFYPICRSRGPTMRRVPRVIHKHHLSKEPRSKLRGI